ncbi:pulmonary surfactant-associated protein B-like isoform X1 [Malaclemys terrapin pileata]|uniref:pulmonary surfactant-associated protein B-like isoform X1 n=1 Tax=Malaclemys terrapin pileata TaxID=2991368 RepID=UPI0023A79C3F|nr:pulmonary surfactant-associated protein B-like isoform X1 [Malaclemys terrapin pileata]XP_053875122.1 pulmonary surfactant-associated protein B-like isoform X1 [Malaclemys terrapin pileata]
MAPLLLLLWLGSALCAQELVPKQCLLGPEFWCRDLGTAAQCRRQQDCKLLEQHMPQQSWHVREQALSIKCTICTSILKKLKSMVGDDPDEDSIVEAEDKLCGVVGRSLRRLCRYVMKKFKPKITAALQDGQDPKEICISLRMCRESPPTQGGLVPPSDACDLCLTFTSLAQPDLQHMRPGWDLGDVLNGTCKRHFGSSPRCNDFVSTYQARLLQVLRVPQDPLTTCLDAEACQLPEESDQGETSSGTDTWAWP